MTGGRPPKGDRQRHPELEELAEWFAQAFRKAGYRSPGAVVQDEVAPKRVVYGIHNAAELPRLQQVKAYAVALGREPAEVLPLWVHAREAMDRTAEAAREAKEPQLTSWAELPQPSLSLKTLLEAQARAVERLPYDTLDVEEPPLSAVYVRQRVRASRDAVPETTERRRGEPRSEPDRNADSEPDRNADSEPDRNAEPPRVEARMPVHDALARHEHLLITGEPGAGKSTLTSHLAWTLARIWTRQETSLSAPLKEPVLPVRIAAHTLVGESASWSATLDRAVRRSMGSSLVADPAPWLFRGRVHGARWLVLLDGLDEITDHDARRAVIRTIAQFARTDSDYRFVITSRSLPDAELSPLRTVAFGDYMLEPFGPEELREFAASWFAAQFGDEQASSAADRFLKETEDSRLRELVSNPLLATIAAVNATISPSRPLPTNRVSLYQAFFARLLVQGARHSSTGRSALRHRLRDEPDRLELHLWLDSNKRAMLRMLGRHRLEKKGPLLDAAADWVRGQIPALVDRLPDWQDDLSGFLRGTGLLVGAENGFRFLHHSFAEYFAAESYAAEARADFPELESWFWRAVQDDDQTLAVFVLCLWADRPDCDPDLVAERLLSGTAGGNERPLLAGLLLAEGVRFGAAASQQLVERLVGIACSGWDRDDQAEAFKVLGGLGHVPTVADRLEDMARSVDMPVEERLLALRAFSRFGPADVAEELLIGVLGGVYDSLDKAAEIACVLGPSAKEAVRRRALAVMSSPAVYPSMTGFVLEALAQMDMSEDVEQLAGTVLADHSVRSTTVGKATEAWMTVTPEATRSQVAEQVVELVLRRPACDSLSCMSAGKVLEKFDEQQAAAELARHLLASDQLWTDPLDWATATLIAVCGDESRPVLVSALERSSPDLGHYPWIPARLRAALTGLGGRAEAAAWARDMLDRSGEFIGYADESVATWLRAEGLSAVEHIMEHTSRGRRVLPHDRPEMARVLLDAGAPAEACEVAELALRTPNALEDGYETAAQILIKVRGISAAELFPDIWKSTPMLAVNSNWLQGVIKALPACTEQADRLLPVISELSRCLIALPSADGKAVMSGLRALLSVEGAAAVPLAVRVAVERCWLSWDQIREVAGHCAALGRRDAAMTVWRHVLSQSDSNGNLEVALFADMQAAGATAEAITWITDILSEEAPHPSRSLRLRQLLAWLEEGERSYPAALPAGP
ncbi:NACHT domain-containing protein [Streptomyces sp. NPDC001796]|uniref:NACHT domain-containing protein n=1 Tax=Streptomyces sp. NPDC001796 TaxID=3364609 RepID=UPI003683629E